MFLCSGCHAEYKLDIDRSLVMKEEVSLVGNDTDKARFDEFNYYLPVSFDADDFGAYEKKLAGVNYYSVHRGDNLLNFKYDHNIDSINLDMFARSCYEYVTVMKNESKKEKKKDLILSTSSKFLCFDRYDTLEDVKVVITSKYKLKDTNADEVEKHKYTWYINKDNYNDKYLYLLVDLNKRDLTFWERVLEGEYFNIFTLFLGILLVGLLIGYLFKKIGDRKNKI